MSRIAVLMGGLSAEREVSLSSGREVAAALAASGHEVIPVDAGPDLGAIVATLAGAGVDCVFNALHGRFGEDGAIQGVLDWLDIPYTHSGVRASAVAMDKTAAKALFAASGLGVALGVLVSAAELERADPMPPPYVVKPNAEGSSVGVEIVHPGSNRRAEIARAWRFGTEALVEEYIPGRELTVGVLGERALTVTEIIPTLAGDHEFYDYEAKYRAGGSRHVLPAEIPERVAEAAMSAALAAHRALGCRGASRADFRYDETAGRLVLLEVNTQPGMTPTSLLPEQARFAGHSFGALCEALVAAAACRT